MEGPLGVRKGGWTEEEDAVLRKYIETHGEGNWHQIPLKAGLNRCRKSCRMRWLNYLRPNINRADFTSDEVDLLIRLHKLLGNRWSLIAGRLPGRTTNAVKNYWNTHLRKNIMVTPKKEVKGNNHETQKRMEANIIKPQPRTFSKNLPWLREKSTILDNIQLNDNYGDPSSTALPPPDGIQWWESLLVNEEGDKIGCSSSISWSGEEPIASPWIENMASVQEGEIDWNEFYFDVEPWENMFFK